MTDEKIIAALKVGGVARDKALEYLYKDTPVYRQLSSYILKYNGTEQDIDDTFQDALVIFDNHIRNSAYEGKSSLNTFLYGIARNVWRNNRKKLQRVELEGDTTLLDGEEEETPETIMLANEQKTIVQGVLEKLGPECKKILLLKQQYKHAEIAEIMNFPLADNAKKKAHRCQLKLRKLLQQHPQYNNLLNSVL